ncbi:MAG: hypothetical protein RL210_965 [Pseudomonadota bacterium]
MSTKPKKPATPSKRPAPKPAPAGRGFFSRLLSMLLYLTLLAGILLGGWFAWFLNTPLNLKQLPQIFTVRTGSTLKAASRQLANQGILPEPWSFWLFARVMGKGSEIKAGSYQITEPITPPQLLEKLVSGDFHLSVVTVIEGWSFKQMRAALNQNLNLQHDSQHLSDAELLHKLGLNYAHAEGLFFPDTYFAALGSSDLQILKRAHQTMQKHLQAAWAERAPGLPYRNPYEALIMASIVEKETGRDADRNLVAAVFVNRLKKGMRLQTDPTVIYGLGDKFDGNLRKIDLLTDTPYNTYTRGGLPPSPIALPGLKSLHSALNPANSNALYFVARGDGSSHFSSTLTEHNRAVNQYQRGR